MGELRVEAVVVGSKVPGRLRIRVWKMELDVDSRSIPAALHAPNSRFIAVVEGLDFVRVEPAGEEWLALQARIAQVLNEDWDPIYVYRFVDDEYDDCIPDIHALLKRHAPADELAAYLLQIEVERWGKSLMPEDHRLAVAHRLLALDLPAL